MACQVMHARTHTHTLTNTWTHYIDVQKARRDKWPFCLMRTQPQSHTSPPPSIPHSLHLFASVTTRGLYSRIPYTAVANKKRAWKSITLSENTTIHLPPSCCSRVAPLLFLFHLSLFLHTFSRLRFISGAPQMDQCSIKSCPFVLCLPIQLHSEVKINIVSLC